METLFNIFSKADLYNDSKVMLLKYLSSVFFNKIKNPPKYYNWGT